MASMVDAEAAPYVPATSAPFHATTGFPVSWRVIPTTDEPLAGQTVVDVDFVSCTS